MNNKYIEDRIQKKFPTGENIVGTSNKYFGIVNDNKTSFDKKLVNEEVYNSDKTTKNSCFFGELFRSLASGKSSYKTYLNSLFENTLDESQYIPSDINCLIKSTRGDSAYGEVVGSRLANLLGLDTVFNVAIVSPEDKNFKWLEDRDTIYGEILSVDYVTNGYETENFKNLGVLFGVDNDFNSWLQRVDEELPRISKKLGFKLTEENLTKFEEDLCKMYIFRNLLCDDLDINCKNINILYNQKTGDFRLAPNLDMELLFRGRGYKYAEEFLARNMRIIREKFPHIIDEMMQKINNNMENGKIEKIMRTSLKFSKSTCDSKFDVVKKNAELLNAFYSCDIHALPIDESIDELVRFQNNFHDKTSERELEDN